MNYIKEIRESSKDELFHKKLGFDLLLTLSMVLFIVALTVLVVVLTNYVMFGIIFTWLGIGSVVALIILGLISTACLDLAEMIEDELASRVFSQSFNIILEEDPEE